MQDITAPPTSSVPPPDRATAPSLPSTVYSTFAYGKPEVLAVGMDDHARNVRGPLLTEADTRAPAIQADAAPAASLGSGGANRTSICRDASGEAGVGRTVASADHRFTSLSSGSINNNSGQASATGAGDTAASEATDTVHLVVGGQAFTVSRTALRDHPDTMLGAMFAEHNEGLLGGRGTFAIDRDPLAFRFILAFLTRGELALSTPPPGLSERAWFQELDFWGIYPPTPDVPPDVLAEFQAGGQLVAEALRGVKPSYLARLKAGFLSAVRFVSPTYSPQPVDETHNLKTFLQLYASEHEGTGSSVGGGGVSAEAAFSAALENWSVWTASESYARSIVRGAERFLAVKPSTSTGASVSSSSGGGTVGDAIAATETAGSIYAASALMSHGAVAQHLLRREFAREGISLSFRITVWPEDATAADMEAAQVSNPYEDCPELGYGAAIVKLWTLKLRNHAEPAVWKVGIAGGDRQRLSEAGLRARKGVAYLLIDARLLLE